MTKPTLAEAIETMDYFTECRGDSKHYVAWAVVKEAAERWREHLNRMATPGQSHHHEFKFSQDEYPASHPNSQKIQAPSPGGEG